MPASQINIDSNTPLGANLALGGATFRTWAPNAVEVYLALKQPAGTTPAAFPKNPDDLLVKDTNGYWSGFVPGVKDGDLYHFMSSGRGAKVSSETRMRGSWN